MEAEPGGTTFKYRNRSAAPPGGITSLRVRNHSNVTPGRVRVDAKGKGTYPVTQADLPLDAMVVVDPPYGLGGQCGEARFGSTGACVLNASGTRVTCE